jgi:transcriptional regulator with XRE-family HTH domain
VHDARLARRWSVGELANRASVSRSVAYLAESGQPTSIEAITRLATALGLRLEAELVDPRQRRNAASSRLADPVHAAMGELEAAHLRQLGFKVGIDEPYQHYQFAGRADVVAWDAARAALLHIENKTRFPDLQELAGSYNAKRAYLAASIGARVGVRRWASQTHVITALWSAEVLHVLRIRRESFRSLCPDGTHAFARWWAGSPPAAGGTSALVVLDPVAAGRQRLFVGMDQAMTVHPRHRGYADAAMRLMVQAGQL